jgi:hypothetical protein
LCARWQREIQQSRDRNGLEGLLLLLTDGDIVRDNATKGSPPSAVATLSPNRYRNASGRSGAQIVFPDESTDAASGLLLEVDDPSAGEMFVSTARTDCASE